MRKKKIFQVVNHETTKNYSFQLPEIDLSRDTAVYIRQSGRKADKKNGESRRMQLGLKQFAMRLRGQDTMDNIRVYDEGAGKSGGLLIIERKELNRLWQDLKSGEIGQVVVSREDRLFRDEHGDQSGAFSRLARESDIWLFVPSFQQSGDLDEYGVVVYYDFKNDEHLKAYKQKMLAAAEYRMGHVKYMVSAKRSKSERGGYDGRALPPGLVLECGIPKDIRKPVVYEPWKRVMEWVFDRGEELGYNANALLREIAIMPYLFPEPTEEDKRRYEFRTTLTRCPNGGYKPTSANIIRAWWSMVVLIGWWPTGNRNPESGIVPVIPNNHPAVLDIDRFKMAYEFCTGQTLEGVEIALSMPKRSLQVRKDSALPEALLHGKLKCPNTEGVHVHTSHSMLQHIAEKWDIATQLSQFPQGKLMESWWSAYES